MLTALHMTPFYPALFAAALAAAPALAGPAPAAMFRNLPPSVLAEVESSPACEEGPPIYERGFVTWRNVLGHGKVDVFLDYAHLLCNGGESFRQYFPDCVATGCRIHPYCGSSGCGKEVFVRLPDRKFKKVWGGNAFSISFGVGRRGVPKMTVNLHGGACGGFGAQPCSVTLYWNGAAFLCPKRPPHWRFRADDGCRLANSQGVF
jgi:hypothetical protein